ncbi:bifunctional DedA family/phosphatase PAP2 family protein [Marinobacter orientalis]|uniref:Bifunctional DedA family/phosphatase PAP2 family protein n=1 Tax=Marinobacter orientalis TaxID=1928859 RepID=A0A7Y0WSR5_9GAMM|nr:bifunctional DedA family/phosphatase PAP2 family protein [Marinobacter orientalis]NMT64061.1 bifunctional DedA family/phosphatase PAP2 family protein [Marinobacter orientalis]TGX49295.1 phosphatase PAP2 family protein [Marinobacter orientalis]
MSSEWLQALTAWLGTNPGWLSAAIFLTAFLESLALAGILIPGVAIIFAASALAGQASIPIIEVLLWAGAGAVAGDGISFALGRLFQGRLDRLWPLNHFPGFIAKGEVFFHLHGGKSVVIGRFVGPIRPVIPLIAGAFLMPWRRFLAFNLSSALAWAPAYVLPGYWVGSALASDFEPPAHFWPVIGISAGILLVIYLLLFRFQLGLGHSSRVYHWLASLTARYHITRRFWRRYTSQRPAQTGEFPLPSLSLALGAGALFMILGQLVTATQLFAPFNNLTLEWFAQLRNPLLDPLMILLTLLADPPILLAAAALSALALGLRGFYAAALHIAGAALLATILVWAIKDLSAIPRPAVVLGPPASGAFPSGHTTGITVFSSLAASFIARESRVRWRWRYYLAFSLPIVLVAISRLYLGVHWFTDVIAGIFLGLSISGLTRASYSRYDNIPLTTDSSLLAAGVAWLLYTAWYVTDNWADAVLLYTPVAG